ncbi:MAG: hypothetical protein QXO86_03880 [Nitrososphaerota archaeon]
MSLGRRLAWFAALALVVRLPFAPFTGHGWDLYVWFKTSELFLREQINIYSYPQLEGFPWGFYAYPPPWLYLLSGAYYAGAALGGGREVTILFMKLPIIVADVFCGLLLWLVARRLGLEPEKAYSAALLYLMNPLTIFISGVWGMFDAIPAFFTLLVLYFLMEGRETASALSLSIATSFKVYPAILLPPILVELARKRGIKHAIIGFLAPFTASLLLISLPFMGDLQSFLGKILYHRSNVGQFTYWALVGMFIGGEYASTLGWILFGAGMVFILYRGLKRPHAGGGPVNLLASAFALFLATSPKVNVQYLVMGLPLFILSAYTGGDEQYGSEVRRRLNILLLAALAFILGSAFAIGYDPSNMGKIYSLSLLEASLGGFLLTVSAGIAGWESVKLFLVLNNLLPLKRRLNERAGVASIVIVALIVITLLPSPAGVRLPEQPVRVAILESPDSLFQPGATRMPQEIYQNIAKPTHIVIPLSPDFVMRRESIGPSSIVSGYFRFRIDSGSWTYAELQNLVSGLRRMGVKVLLGVFTKSKDLLVSYGIQGYESTWFNDNSHLIDGEDRMLFGLVLPDNTTLAELYSRKISETLRVMNFDGVYILTPEAGVKSVSEVEWLEPLLIELRAELGPSKELFVDGYDPAAGTEALRRLLNYADYVVAKSPVWFKELTSEQVRLGGEYAKELRSVVSSLSAEEKRRVLYSLMVMDFSGGWLVPALQVQLQVDTYSAFMDGGYVIYFASRYIPFRLTAGFSPTT